MLPRVFDPFFTTKEIGKGTGLGLSQVYGFARQSGGTATIASGPGTGTTVTLFLPASTETPAPHDSQAAAATPPGAGLRLLLVEDNAETGALTRIWLERLGFDVVVAASGLAALTLLEMRGYALLVTEIAMPGGMSGLELARELRARDARIPVILTSRWDDAAQQARQEGFTVLQKPYPEQHLREAVSAAMASIQSQDAAAKA